MTLVLGMVGLSALLFACSSDSGSADPTSTAAATGTAPAAAESSVDAGLTDFVISLSSDTAPAGAVTFNANNTGATPHELVIVKTDLAQDALPVADGKVDETQVSVLFEIEEFPAGESRTATYELEAGSYVLICNVAGHYQLGMHVPFTVE